MGKQQIAIEIQGQKQKYFLTREQEYMAKLISGQVKEGEGKLYHEKVLDTYIIVIAKKNMFVGNTALSDHKLFEIDVEPRIVQTGEKYPGNKMHWKFYELEKFKESNQYAKIKEYDKLDKDSEEKLIKEKFEWLKDNLKEQWLEFLIECNSQKEIPDRNELIKKGYNIMKLATWDPKDQALYWKQKQAEIDFIKQKEYDKNEAEKFGFIKAEVQKYKDFKDLVLKKEMYVSKFKYLQEKNFSYIDDHIDETNTQIMGEMDIEMD